MVSKFYSNGEIMLIHPPSLNHKIIANTNYTNQSSTLKKYKPMLVHKDDKGIEKRIY
jgi:hypothetical protein